MLLNDSYSDLEKRAIARFINEELAPILHGQAHALIEDIYCE